MSETLGLILVRSGAISREALYRGLDLQRQTGRFLGSCLLALDLITPEVLRTALQQQLGIPAVDGAVVLAAASSIAGSIPVEVAAQYRIVPFALTAEEVSVAVYNPVAADILSDLERFVGKKLALHFCDEAVVERAIAKLYPGLTRTMTRLPVSSPVAQPVLGEPVVPDRRQPSQIIGALEEISNRDFASALGLEETVEPVLLVTRRRQSRVVAEVPDRPLPLIDAAEKVFSVDQVVDIAAITVQFLRNYFDAAVVFDFFMDPPEALVHSGYGPGVGGIDLTRFPPIMAVTEHQQAVHGLAPSDQSWLEFFDTLGRARPGAIFVGSVHERSKARLLFFAASDRPEVYEDIHDLAIMMREVTTALSMLEGTLD